MNHGPQRRRGRERGIIFKKCLITIVKSGNENELLFYEETSICVSAVKDTGD